MASPTIVVEAVVVVVGKLTRYSGREARYSIGTSSRAGVAPAVSQNNTGSTGYWLALSSSRDFYRKETSTSFIACASTTDERDLLPHSLHLAHYVPLLHTFFYTRFGIFYSQPDLDQTSLVLGYHSGFTTFLVIRSIISPIWPQGRQDT